jgi:SAM-dependent methyltransferase
VSPSRLAPRPRRSSGGQSPSTEGWRGWNEYAEFYDWENARTMGRRDLGFWRAFARDAGGRVLELGCGTGRVTVPLARAGVSVLAVDRSAAMLARAALHLGRARVGRRVRLIRGDVTTLPVRSNRVRAVLAPYGILQSLLSDRALAATLDSVFRVLAPGGRFGLELVPDVPRWRETDRRVGLIGLDGPNGRPVTLIETVRQDRARRVTTFEHEFLEGTGRSQRSLRFTIRFRTLRVSAMLRRLERAGFVVEGTYGGYRGEAWTETSDTWLVVTRKPR